MNGGELLVVWLDKVQVKVKVNGKVMVQGLY